MTGRADNDVDAALLDRVRAGDEAALGEAFRVHHDRLLRIVQFRLDRGLRRRVEADDILQEAYLAAHARLEHFRTANFPSVFLWLRLIVQQVLVDVHRHHMGTKQRDPRREVPLGGGGASPTTSFSLAARLVENATSPSGLVMRKEMVDRVETAIGQLAEIDQEILALRHFEELTNQEVAAVLGIRGKAASIRYIRALKRLRDVLAEIPDFASSAALPAGRVDGPDSESH